MIRSITETDVPNIHAVALEAWNHTYRNIFEQPFMDNFVDQYYAPEAILSLFPRIQSGTMCFYVAEYESNVIGFYNIGIDQRIAELYRIYLLPVYIGRGVGQKLLGLGEKFLLEHGIHTYFCYVHKDNETGKHFYFRSAFQYVPEKDHDDEWYMEKRLAFS
jgi:ribosomal protein S18 acetylase RimI-like enzyme